jgi:hypothetical protein
MELYEALHSGRNHQFPLEEPDLAERFFENLHAYTGFNDPQPIPYNDMPQAAPSDRSHDSRNRLNTRVQIAETSNQTHDLEERDSDEDDATLHSSTPNHLRSLSLSYPAPNYGVSGRPARVRRASTARTRQQPSRLLMPGRKTRSQIRMEIELQERETDLRTQLATRFTANPIPASSILPRYNKIKLASSTRASEAREKRVKELIKQSKPFTFRETVQKKARKDSGTVDDTISKVLAEISKLHKKKERMKKGGVESNIVRSAANDGVERKKRAEESVKNEGMTKEHTFAPKINKNIPDFERIQRVFLETRRNSTAKQTTRAEPFAITDSNVDFVAYSKASLEAAIEEVNDIDTAISTRWPFMKTQRVRIGKEFTAKYASAEFKTTKSSELQKEVIKANRRKEELAKEVEDSVKREKERKSKV